MKLFRWLFTTRKNKEVELASNSKAALISDASDAPAAVSSLQTQIADLHTAARKDDALIVKKLLIDGVDKDSRLDGDTALHVAAGMGCMEVVAALIEAGADVNAIAHSGGTALHYAAGSGHLAIAESLVKKGVNKDIQDEGNQWTALHWACFKGHEGMVEFLLNSGVQLDIQGKNNLTALHWAANKGRSSIAGLLLQAGASTEIKAGNDCTPLHYAATEGRTKAVDVLLKHGASTDATDVDGASPLHWASIMGHTGIVDLLLKAGAAKDCHDKKGRTPLDYAQLKEYPEIVQLLCELHTLSGEFVRASNALRSNEDESGKTAFEVKFWPDNDDAKLTDTAFREALAAVGIGSEIDSTDGATVSLKLVNDRSSVITMAASDGTLSVVVLIVFAGAESHIINRFAKVMEQLSFHLGSVAKIQL